MDRVGLTDGLVVIVGLLEGAALVRLGTGVEVAGTALGTVISDGADDGLLVTGISSVGCGPGVVSCSSWTDGTGVGLSEIAVVEVASSIALLVLSPLRFCPIKTPTKTTTISNIFRQPEIRIFLLRTTVMLTVEIDKQ